MAKSKILLYDIETTPSEGLFWGGRKYDQTILKVTKERELLSVAWQWYGSDVVHCDTRQGESSDKRLVGVLRDLLQEADMSVAHNGDKFDITVSKTRMIYHGLQPLKHQISVDTCKVAKKHFSFTGNSLDDLAGFFKIGNKLPTPGLSLWVRCMSDVPESWREMVRYNKHDVFPLLRGVYDRLRPWIENHPNLARIKNPKFPSETCPDCENVNTMKFGLRPTGQGVQQRWVCKDCGKNFLTKYKVVK